MRRAPLAGIVVALATFSGAADAAPRNASACIDAHVRAQLERNAGHFLAARAALYACAQSECPRAIHAECAKWLEEINTTIPTVVVAARGPGAGDGTDVRVRVDGAAEARPLDGKPFELDPGEHVFECTSANATQRVKALVTAGESAKRIVCDLTPPSPSPAPAPAPPPASAPSAPTTNARDNADAQAPARTAWPWPVWALGGVGVVAAGSATFFYVSALGRWNDLRASCGDHCSADQISGLKWKHRWGDVSTLVSVLSFGGAAVIVLTHRSDKPPSTRLGFGPGDVRLEGEF